ncbi:hypothetical protein D3C72_2236530 [compost metagenome]
MAAANPIQSGMAGTDWMNSMKRWMRLSTTPPNSPEMPPMRMPNSRLSATPISPIVMEMRVP